MILSLSFPVAATLFVSQLFLLGLGPLSLNRRLLLVEKTNLLVLGRERESENKHIRGMAGEGKREGGRETYQLPLLII